MCCVALFVEAEIRSARLKTTLRLIKSCLDQFLRTSLDKYHFYIELFGTIYDIITHFPL